MTNEWLSLGEQTLEVRARPDDPEGRRLTELMDLHVTCGRIAEIRFFLVHVTAVVSAIALLVRRAGTLIPASWPTDVWTGWDVIVMCTVFVLAVEGYWRWRWRRCAARYQSPLIT